MRLIYVDDEKNSLVNFHYDTRHRKDISSIEFFQSPHEAIKYVREHPVDAAFLDITMPDMDGIVLAGALKKINLRIEIIYITAYDNYALAAFQVGGRAYIRKPYTKQELDDAFDLLRRLLRHEEPAAAQGASVPEPEPVQMQTQNPVPQKTHRVFMKTFGTFDMIVDSRPVVFKNAKAKELLALLVDHKGSSVTNAQVFAKLWEDKAYTSSTASYVRRTMRALLEQLEEIDLASLVHNSRNAQYIDVKAFDCDYYQIMDGHIEYVLEYNGYYMSQYDWAEETVFIIERKIKLLKQTEKL